MQRKEIEYGIICPYCKEVSDTRVIDSRPCRLGVKRRRECQFCGKRYTTVEHTTIYPSITMPMRKEAD